VRRRGVPIERVVDDALHEGLSRGDEPAATDRFRTRTVWVGPLRLTNLDDVSAALEFAEGDRLA